MAIHAVPGTLTFINLRLEMVVFPGPASDVAPCQQALFARKRAHARLEFEFRSRQPQLLGDPRQDSATTLIP